MPKIGSKSQKLNELILFPLPRGGRVKNLNLNFPQFFLFLMHRKSPKTLMPYMHSFNSNKQKRLGEGYQPPQA